MKSLSENAIATDSLDVAPTPIDWSLRRQADFGAGVLMLISCLLSWTVHPHYLLFVVLIGVGHIATSFTGFCLLQAILQKMPWNRAGKAKEVARTARKSFPLPENIIADIPSISKDQDKLVVAGSTRLHETPVDLLRRTVDRYDDLYLYPGFRGERGAPVDKECTDFHGTY